MLPRKTLENFTNTCVFPFVVFLRMFHKWFSHVKKRKTSSFKWLKSTQFVMRFCFVNARRLRKFFLQDFSLLATFLCTLDKTLYFFQKTKRVAGNVSTELITKCGNGSAFIFSNKAINKIQSRYSFLQGSEEETSHQFVWNWKLKVVHPHFPPPSLLFRVSQKM